MKDRIKKGVIESYKNIKNHDDKSIETFVDLIMNETTDAIIDEIKKELEKEFHNGTLQHSFLVSPKYYLELKLKDAKQNFFSRDKK